jgi:hypothetical protein
MKALSAQGGVEVCRPLVVAFPLFDQMIGDFKHTQINNKYCLHDGLTLLAAVASIAQSMI